MQTANSELMSEVKKFKNNEKERNEALKNRNSIERRSLDALESENQDKESPPFRGAFFGFFASKKPRKRGRQKRKIRVTFRRVLERDFSLGQVRQFHLEYLC